MKADAAQGSAYVAIMVTGGHGVRMQDNFTGDIAGPGRRGVSAVAAADPQRRHRHRVRLLRRHDVDDRRRRRPRAPVGCCWPACSSPRLPSRPSPSNSVAAEPSPAARRSPPRPSIPLRCRAIGPAPWTGETVGDGLDAARLAGIVGFDAGGRDVHRHRGRRHRAGQRRQRHPDRTGAGRRLRGADHRRGAGRAVHHHRIPARDGSHDLHREPAAGQGAGREGDRHRRGHLRHRVARGGDHRSGRRATCWWPTAISSTRSAVLTELRLIVGTAL